MPGKRWAVTSVTLAVLAIVATSVPFASRASATTLAPPGVLLPSGRLVTPAGSTFDATRKPGDASYDLGDFPLGLALSPDGTLAVASLNGRGVGAPHGFNSFCEQDQSKPGYSCPGVPAALTVNPRTKAPDEGLDVVDLRTGRVVQVVAVPTNYSPTAPQVCGKAFNCFGMGVAFSPDGTHVYASGGGQDAIYDFAVSGSTLHLVATVNVPSLAERTPALPILGAAAGYPRAVQAARTPRGVRLVVANEFDSTIEVYDVDRGRAPLLLSQGLVPGGVPGAIPVAYLYDLAISPDGAHAYVTAQGTGVVYVVDLALFETLGQLPVAVAVPVPLLGVDHPTGVAVSPNGSTLAVTGTNSDNVAFLPLVAGVVPNGVTPTLLRLGVIARPPTQNGSAPDAVAWSRDGKRAYVALAGDDAVAVVDTSTSSPSVSGYVPTAWYPTAVAIGPKDGRVYALNAKGLGSRYVPGAGGYVPAPGAALPPGASLPSSDYYDAENMPGVLQRFTPSSPAALRAYSEVSASDVLHAGGLDQRPAASPIPATVGEPSPITHVVYIVRENRTFDQVFGDLGATRKDADAAPYYQVLAPATPNAHAIASQFAIADHFFSDGGASVQGHWWTSSAASSDYIEKSWRQYYSPRRRPSDSADQPITSPPGCSIFQDVQRHALSHPGFTYRNYGELVGLANPSTSTGTPQQNLCNGGLAADPASVPFLDPNYPSQALLTPDDRSRSAEFLKDSGLKANGTDAGNGNTLRNFNYLILSEDHTSGLAGTQTPRSQVAQNDAALGQIVSSLSKSKYWSSTAVFVTEDDSQDGADHIDGHRNVLLVASPWTKHASGDGCGVPGYIGHSHYDQAGVLRTVELILGLDPISAYDAGATPLYDLFQPQATSLSTADLKPFDTAADPRFINETVASLPKTRQTNGLVIASRMLDTTHIDAAEAQLEGILWQSVRNDPLPAELAAKAAGADDAVTLAPDRVVTESVQVRPGTAPNVSTVTGKPLPAGVTEAACTVASVHRPLAPSGPLPVTGGSSPWAPLAVVVLGAVVVRRRVSSR